MLPSFARRAKLEPLKILFQDKGIFVIDKPAGLVSQGGIDHARAARGEATIEDHFYNLKSRLALTPEQWIRSVHRLDKSTTGPLILATTELKAKDLCAQFAERSIEKSYIAAISRYLTPEEREQEGEHVGWMESDDGLVSLSEKGKVGAKEVKTEWEWLGGDVSANFVFFYFFYWSSSLCRRDRES
ncbi:pseudouridine synthase [Mrakia frigida]|uniref:pseudouridine synthase n=1 Tax=Mrakia frigida TaxID=29902 RepID=UPI003FCBF70D